MAVPGGNSSTDYSVNKTFVYCSTFTDGVGLRLLGIRSCEASKWAYHTYRVHIRIFSYPTQLAYCIFSFGRFLPFILVGRAGGPVAEAPSSPWLLCFCLLTSPSTCLWQTMLNNKTSNFIYPKSALFFYIVLKFH